MIVLKQVTAKVKSLQEHCNNTQAEVNRLTNSMEAATAKIGTLEKEVEDAKANMQANLESYRNKIAKLESELEELEINHNTAHADVATHKKAVADMKALQDENLQLHAAIKELREKELQPVPDSDIGLQEMVRVLESELAQAIPMMAKAHEWKVLAEVRLVPI